MTTSAWASSMICSISVGASRQLTDTLTAPSLARPKVTSNHSRPFLSMNATRSPTSTPAARNAWATWLERASSSPKVTVRSPTSNTGLPGLPAPCVRMMSAIVLIGSPMGECKHSPGRLRAVPPLTATDEYLVHQLPHRSPRCRRTTTTGGRASR